MLLLKLKIINRIGIVKVIIIIIINITGITIATNIINIIIIFIIIIIEIATFTIITTNIFISFNTAHRVSENNSACRIHIAGKNLR